MRLVCHFMDHLRLILKFAFGMATDNPRWKGVLKILYLMGHSFRHAHLCFKTF